MQTIFQSTFPFTLHTVFKVLESFFTVTLFTVTMETLHSQTLKAHITGQVINSDVEQKWKRANTKDTRLKWVPMLMSVYPTVTVVNSHNYEPTPHLRKLLANKDDYFFLRLHVSDEVKQIWLFLLFANNQHCLLHRVNSLIRIETQEACKQNPNGHTLFRTLK